MLHSLVTTCHVQCMTRENMHDNAYFRTGNVENSKRSILAQPQCKGTRKVQLYLVKTWKNPILGPQIRGAKLCTFWDPVFCNFPVWKTRKNTIFLKSAVFCLPKSRETSNFELFWWSTFWDGRHPKKTSIYIKDFAPEYCPGTIIFLGTPTMQNQNPNAKVCTNRYCLDTPPSPQSPENDGFGVFTTLG